MKKLVVTALLMVGMTSMAQEVKTVEVRKQRTEKMTPEQRNEMQLKKMTAELNLTASQQAEVAKLLAEKNVKREAAKAERKAAKEAGKAIVASERAERKAQIMADQKATDERFMKILTSEQYAKLQQIKAERKDKLKDRKVVKTKKVMRKQEMAK